MCRASMVAEQVDSQGQPDESSVETWQAIAAGWERHHDQLLAHTSPVDERMAELVDVHPGEVVLELAAGLGTLSRSLAARVAPGGEVICTDGAPAMVEAARRHTDDSLPVSFRVMDAQAIGLDDRSVDAVVCKMGLMLMPDGEQAAREAGRVLRPGGRFVAATWGPLEHNLWLATFGAAMLTHDHAPPSDATAPGGIFSLATTERLELLLRSAGFGDVAVESVAVPERVASFEDYWQLRAATSGPLTLALDDLDEEQAAAVKASCREFAANHQRDDGSYEFPGRALIALARR
jgi:SAM-dependent methyltransferase